MLILISSLEFSLNQASSFHNSSWLYDLTIPAHRSRLSPVLRLFTYTELLPMKNLSLRLIVLSALFLASCVPGKKIAYLQYEREFKRPRSVIFDSNVRKYQSDQFAYKLQSNDLLDIKISTLTPTTFNPFADADRSLLPGQGSTVSSQTGSQIQPQGYYIDEAGFTELPILGKVKIKGLTIKQSEDTLAAHVLKFLKEPVVRVKILNFRFTVIGEVTNQSTLVSGDNNLTLLQGLSMAGGATEFGDLSRVKLIRHSGPENQVYYVDLLNEQFLSSPFYNIQPNDILVVTPIKQRTFLKYMAPNLSLVTASVSLLIGVVTLFKIW
jgi:polysaccharide biosynthesis/export protein